MGLTEGGCEDGMWMELAHDRNQWPGFGDSKLNLRVLLLEIFGKSINQVITHLRIKSLKVNVSVSLQLSNTLISISSPVYLQSSCHFLLEDKQLMISSLV
jgi:hypothetical protein